MSLHNVLKGHSRRNAAVNDSRNSEDDDDDDSKNKA
jgi:hypothetical protein